MISLWSKRVLNLRGLPLAVKTVLLDVGFERLITYFCEEDPNRPSIWLEDLLSTIEENHQFTRRRIEELSRPENEELMNALIETLTSLREDVKKHLVSKLRASLGEVELGDFIVSDWKSSCSVVLSRH